MTKKGEENPGRKMTHADSCYQQVKLAESLYSIKIDFYTPKSTKQILKLYDFLRNN